jgi:hypothetical protein
MRQRIMVALVVLLIPWVAPAATLDTTPDSTSIDELQLTLELVPATAPIAQQRDSVKAHLDQYRQLILQAQAITRSGRYQIDIIGQQHGGPNMDADTFLEMGYSQWRIRQLLDSLRYEVIGIEGYDIDRVTWPAMLTDVIHQMKNLGQPVVTAEDTLRLQKFIIMAVGQVDGLHYFVAHPSAHLSGVDEDRLHFLFMQAMSLPGLQMDPPPPEVIRFFVTVSKARCEVAVAKLVIQMQKNRWHRAVIVMGLNHQTEFSEITSRYHIQSQYFPTLAGPTLGPQWWK